MLIVSTNCGFFCVYKRIKVFFVSDMTLLKRSPLKSKFLRLLSAWVKLCQITHGNFERQVNSSSNFESFFILVTQNASAVFKLIHFLLCIKEYTKIGSSSLLLPRNNTQSHGIELVSMSLN